MRLQVLSSGSEGNSTLVRGGESTLLVDAGLTRIALEARLESARVPAASIDHVLVTHGHLDHARSVGMIAKRAHATLHCAEAMMLHPSAKRASRSRRCASARATTCPTAPAPTRSACCPSRCRTTAIRRSPSRSSRAAGAR
ncbi:MAG: MBL fold metallo-hydrolase [Planctomycetes bacterium]|nr:MBL fold metallo-hydrolase [Planctomycetota bacterium]